MRTYEAFAANDRGIGHDFWLFHGINYLSGNPFPGIYAGDQVYRGRIFSHIMESHLDSNGALTERGRECLVWASTKPPELYRAVVYIKTFATKYRRDFLLPDDPYVKVAVEAAASLMLSATEGWGDVKAPTPKEYHKDHPRQYSKQLVRAADRVVEFDPRRRKGWEFWAELHRKTIAALGLPKGVEPFRLEYRERNGRGYLRHTGRLEDRPRGGVNGNEPENG